MNYLKLKQKIYEAIERNPLDRSAYEEMFAVCREYEKIDFQTAHAWNHELRNHISWGLRMTVSCQKFDEAREFDDLMFRSLLFGAQHFFDDYLQAVEYGKPLDKKFYQPRRHYLRRYVDAYQEILDGKLDFLSISMPKRAGKSQLGINFTNMLSGKYPDRASQFWVLSMWWMKTEWYITVAIPIMSILRLWSRRLFPMTHIFWVRFRLSNIR